MRSSPHSRLKNLRLRLRSQQAHVSSINAKGAFAEHGRMDLKKEVSGRDQETKSLHGRWWQSFKETEPYHDKDHFLHEEKFSRSWTSFIKARPWKHLKRCCLILKSLNNDNFWRRLQENIEALGSFCSSEHMPFKEALEGEQSRRSSSEHMSAKENSQDEWLLGGSWPIYRLANGH